MHLIIRTALMLCTMLLFATQGLAASVQQYVVLPFQVTGSSGFSYLEQAIPSMLTSRLYWQDHFQPVSSAQAAKAGAVKSAAAVAKAQAATGADYAIWGTVTVMGEEASLDVQVRDKAGKEWRKGSKAPVNDLISVLQQIADSINADVFGRPVSGAAKTAGAGTMVNQMNPNLVRNEMTQSQVYLNPQFRYQGSDGTRYRSQNLPFAGVGMEIADVNGNGKNDIVVLSEHSVFVYEWTQQGLRELGEYKLPTNFMALSLRTIDLNRDNVNEIVVSTYDEGYTDAYSFVLSFKGNKFTEIAKRVPYFMNVVRLTPDFMPVLVGQKSDPSRIFARSGVQEMIRQGDTFVGGRKLNLPAGANLFNFAWLPGKAGHETDKLVMLTDDENLRTMSPQGSQLAQSSEKYSGSAIGIEEQTSMLGMGKSSALIPSKYFMPLRMIASDLEKDGDWELLVNKPISVSAQFFENYRFFPEGEIHSLFWDGVGLSLQWKTRRIKGSVIDFALGDPNNDGVQDLVVCINTHPGALGLQHRKTVIIAYPLDLSLTDPKTAPALE